MTRATSPYDHDAGKPYHSHGYRSVMGRSTVEIVCPHCGTQSRAYIWSLSGGGKKCENRACGAMHTSTGLSYPVKPK